MRRLALLLAAFALPVLAQPVIGGPGLVEGAPAEVAQLDGRWVGAYEVAASGARGTLTLEVDAAAGRAVVTLIDTPGPTAPPTVLRLAVHHLDVEGGAFRGSLARFVDPVWGIEMETAVGGALGPGGRLDGHFFSGGTAIDTIPVEGRWWAVRAADRPAL